MKDTAGGREDDLGRFKRIDELADQFEAAFNEGKNPLIEDYLAKHPELCPQLALDLLELELSLRKRNGEQLDENEYLTRFPDYRTLISEHFLSTIAQENSETLSVLSQPVDLANPSVATESLPEASDVPNAWGVTQSSGRLAKVASVGSIRPTIPNWKG